MEADVDSVGVDKGGVIMLGEVTTEREAGSTTSLGHRHVSISKSIMASDSGGELTSHCSTLDGDPRPAA